MKMRDEMRAAFATINDICTTAQALQDPVARGQAVRLFMREFDTNPSLSRINDLLIEQAESYTASLWKQEHKVMEALQVSQESARRFAINANSMKI